MTTETMTDEVAAPEDEQAAVPSHVLDLTGAEDEQRPRPEVKLPGGKVYELYLPHELTMRQQADVSRLTRRVMRVLESDGEKDVLNDAEAARLERDMHRFLLLLFVDAPEAEVLGMRAEYKFRLLQFYHSLAQPPRAASGNPEGGQPSSPASAGSTAAP